MKKFLLLTSALVLASQLQAADNMVLEGVTINKLSPDGRYGVASMYGNLFIYDFDNPDNPYIYAVPEEDYSTNYGIGNGNSVSNTGIVLGSTTIDYEPSYWENGEWKELPHGDATGVFMVNGITPDGSRICGTMSPNKKGEPNIVPVVWNRNADGTYGDFEVLPYPTVDFTGRLPQYVTALCISDDGKTIAGQVQEFRGMVHQPIVYRQNDKNEWSYELIHPELLNPNDVKFPEPLPEVDCPEAQDFMTPEKAAEYQEALEAYWNSGYNPDLEPNAADYMTDEEIAAFNEAARIYNEYNDRDTEFINICNQIMEEGGVIFEFNNVYMSGDGKYYATTHKLESFNPETWENVSVTAPYIFNLETGEYKSYENEESISVTFLDNKGTMLCSTPVGFFATTPTQAYAIPYGGEKILTLAEFLSDCPKTIDWMKENMTHDGVMVGMNPETYEPILENNYMITGLPVANADMSMISTWTGTDYWDIENMDKPLAYSYIMYPVKESSTGIDAPAADGSIEVGVVDGVITLAGDVTSVSVYDLNGRMVLDVANPAAQVETGLAAGFYVIKAVAATGEVTTLKAAF